jgi:hypothetical protein
MYSIQRDGAGIPPWRGADKMGNPFYLSALAQIGSASGARSDTAWTLIGLALVQLVWTSALVIGSGRRVQLYAKTDGDHVDLKVHGRKLVQLRIPAPEVVAFELRTHPGDPRSPYGVLVTRSFPPYDLFTNDVDVPRRHRGAAIRALERWRQERIGSS